MYYIDCSHNKRTVVLIAGLVLRKDLGHSKPAIVPRKQAHQLIMWGFKTISKLPELLKLN
jgi:hypothetical protein